MNFTSPPPVLFPVGVTVSSLLDRLLDRRFTDSLSAEVGVFGARAWSSVELVTTSVCGGGSSFVVAFFLTGSWSVGSDICTIYFLYFSGNLSTVFNQEDVNKCQQIKDTFWGK